jgi:phosphatidate cytidylyltransferase
MKTRVITAIVAIVILVCILVFSATPVLPLAAMICALIAVYEITGCVDIRKKWALSLTTYIFSVAIMVLVFVHFLNYLTIPNFTAVLFAVLYIYVFLIFALTMFSKGTIAFSQAAELIALTFYILIGFISIVLLRNVEPAGKYIYLLIFIGAWMTDTGAYFIGVFFGKHKLIPEVSPKKTVEGAFGGVLGCIVGYVIFGVILNIFFDVTVNYIALILLAIVISVISQCGDLIASYVKRERGIKDYGSIFPGHGGMMDRFDSIIAVAPVILGIILLLPADIQIFSLIAK